VRERDCTPPPHGSVQSVYARGLHVDTTQSTGAGVGAAVGAGVGAHDLVHLPQLPNVCLQWMGHAFVLQLMVSRRAACAGHALPPWFACVVMVRERDCTPPPHGSVQSVTRGGSARGDAGGAAAVGAAAVAAVH
jgi:hypothetical protein